MYQTFDRALAWAVSIHCLFPCFSSKVLGSSSSKAAVTLQMPLGNCEQEKSPVFSHQLYVSKLHASFTSASRQMCAVSSAKVHVPSLDFMQTVYIKLATCINKYSTACLVCMSAECCYTQLFLKASVFYAHCVESLSVSGGQCACCQHLKKCLPKNGQTERAIMQKVNR